MGVCDYVCFMQGANQCHEQHQLLEEPEPGGPYADIYPRDDISFLTTNQAYIVLVPDSISRNEVLKMTPAQLASYPSILRDYSCSDWDFEPSMNYRPLLLSDYEQVESDSDPTNSDTDDEIWTESEETVTSDESTSDRDEQTQGNESEEETISHWSVTANPTSST